jgi:hypothetical protein
MEVLEGTRESITEEAADAYLIASSLHRTTMNREGVTWDHPNGVPRAGCAPGSGCQRQPGS